MVAEKKGKKLETYTLGGMIKLKGFVKNGLDSSTLINLIVVFDSNTPELSRRGFTVVQNSNNLRLKIGEKDIVMHKNVAGFKTLPFRATFLAS